MLKFTSGVCALIMAATVPSATPAVAMPVGSPVWDQQKVTDVQYRDRYYRDRPNRVIRRGDGYYYNGYRGHRHYRHGYRRHDGLWYAPGAFIAGAIIGGAIASQQQPPVQYRPRGGSHEEWCYNRYRSYRAYDNTFQPYNGPRRQCHSPYG